MFQKLENSKSEMFASWSEEQTTVISSHSTLCYEALMCGVPVIFYRPTRLDVPPMITSKLGLAPEFRDPDALGESLKLWNANEEHKKLGKTLARLKRRQLFVNDGTAKAKILGIVKGII